LASQSTKWRPSKNRALRARVAPCRKRLSSRIAMFVFKSTVWAYYETPILAPSHFAFGLCCDSQFLLFRAAGFRARRKEGWRRERRHETPKAVNAEAGRPRQGQARGSPGRAGLPPAPAGLVL